MGAVLGFTGTRRGMSAEQKEALRAYLVEYDVSEFHHGDCLGADAEAHLIVRGTNLAIRIVVHPPIDPKKRAYCEGDVILPPEEYDVRNRAIAVACSTLLVAPKGCVEEKRGSGTWMTYRMAEALKRRTVMLWP